MPLLTQNGELRPHLIWNWSIPALTAKLSDGKRIQTCPSAGICARLCYARTGAYLFSNVLAAHTRNLEMVVNDTDNWRNAMNNELRQTKFTRQRNERTVPMPKEQIADAWLLRWVESGKPAIRIHDSGDFFADWYLREWLNIAEQHPELLFYAYTKEIKMLSAIETPNNFRWLASTGGSQDHLITDDMRHADVFPNEEQLKQAGYTDQSGSDLLAVLLPTNKIGIPANNIRHFKNKMGTRTFSQIQKELHND